MRTKDKIASIIIIIIFLYIIANLGAINSFLTFSTDKTIDVGNSQIVVPEAWNTTSELNLTDKVKTNDSITNGYLILNIWENWPEDHITNISTERFKGLEPNGYEVINESVVKLSGQNVSKQYFYIPERDTDKIWDCIGLNYVFSREDKNYAIQVQYFTKIDYQNETYNKELDDRIEDIIVNIHNKQYDGFVSALQHIYTFFQSFIKQK